MGKWVMNAYCKMAPVIITVLLILTGMAFGLGEYLEKIEIEPVDAWFRTIKNFFPDTWDYFLWWEYFFFYFVASINRGLL